MVYVILILGISFLILIHEFGHFLAARFFGCWVEEFGIGFPPRLFGKKIGETLWSVNALPFGGFVKIHGEQATDEVDQKPERSFAVLSVSKRAAIIVAGVVMNFIVGFVIISGIFMVGAPTSVIVSGISEGSPAATEGIKEGDRLLGFESSEDFIVFVREMKGKEVTLRLLREGEELVVTAVPRENPPEGEGALGVSVTEVGSPKLPFFESIIQGFITSAKIVGAIFVSLANIIVALFTEAPAFEGFVGPIGIFGVANETAQFGFIYLFQLIALISLNLVALNVLPFPALDGGRLFFLLIEKIKGSPISPKREGLVNTIGFGILLLLMVVITVRDVVNLF
ncbi:MAG: site-2 protease family protein [Patescibacteria group bacterium]